MVTSIVPVTAIVDWNSQIYLARPPKDDSEYTVAEKTLEYVCKVIGKSLDQMDRTLKYDVTLRIYHGWYRGFEPTSRRKALTQLAAGVDYRLLSTKPNVSFRNVIEFGDRLISATIERLHIRLNCHVPNTQRYALDDPQKSEEKMVDTAIASDVVDIAYSDPKRWIVVVGDDDDLVPPVFTAEGARGKNDGKIILIRTRPETPFLKLDRLRFVP